MLEKHRVNRIACFFLCVLLATHNFVFFEIYDRNTSGASPLIFVYLLMVYFYVIIQPTDQEDQNYIPAA